MNNIDVFISNEQEITRSNCKLCNSKLRKEAEAKIDNGASILSVFKYLESNGEKISYCAVKNHINYHFKSQEEQSSLQEFATKLDKWSGVSKADDDLINRYISVLDMEAMHLAAKNADLDNAERRKNDEVILKMTAQIASLKETLRKLHSELRPVEIIFSSLNKIIEIKLKGDVNPEVRQVLREVIEELSKEVGDLPIEGIEK